MRLLSKAARNERRKITATYFNTLASATIAVGGLAPLAALIYGSGGAGVRVGPLTFGVVICFLGSFVLHLVARWFLEGIEE
nr:amino acid transporter [uncultured Devosia sp.]